MRRLAAPLVLFLSLGCNGSTAPGVHPQPDAEEPGPEPDPGTRPDGAAATIPDGASLEPDAPPVTEDAPVVVPPTGVGPDTTVTAFAGTPVYFTSGMDNKRMVDATVKFPDAGLLYKSATLKLALRCPPAGCDFWDRRAYLGLVRKNGDKETVTEILRFMTPYRVAATWTADVTALRPLLSGPVTLRVFIDTWVGPGNAAQGAGWLVDASFDLVGGMPERLPIAVIPLWDETKFDYGDPAKPVSAAVATRSITLPAGAGAVELRSFITGHGQGNLDNCAEFCRRNHAFTVGGMRVERMVWRDDCATTAIPNQGGNWKPSRAGWCPGAQVLPWVADVSAMAKPGNAITVTYDVQPYENTCRPDSPTCAGCVFRTPCAFDNGNHTAPFFVLSAALIVYGR
jgi:hypothetical protein